jgi:hypothetical protein
MWKNIFLGGKGSFGIMLVFFTGMVRRSIDEIEIYVMLCYKR